MWIEEFIILNINLALLCRSSNTVGK